MGKPEAPPPAHQPADGQASVGPAARWAPRIRGAVSLRCAIAVLLSAAVFVSAFFSLPLSRGRTSEFLTRNTDALAADIQATFNLQKPFSRLVSHIGGLEYDILEEIEVPNTKVNIVSMRPMADMNSTKVVFAVLPNLKSTSISLPALSMLRSSLIDLVLRQVNMSLTPSIFGQPSSFNVLKFPGGMTVIPTQSASIWERTEVLFNFTLNNSIGRIEEDLQKLKDQLKFGLDLKSYENVYVQLTNLNGSTVAPPVTVQASILSDYGSRDLLPDRLKQLAHVITGSHAENFGLNHSVFGKVKEVVLSSYLQHSISVPSPSPSPSLPPSGEPPYSSPSPYASSPSPDHHQPPCLYCDIRSPTGSPFAHAPIPQNAPQSPARSNAPGPSVAYIAPSPKRRPCLSSPLAPKASSVNPPASTNHGPSSAIPPQYKTLGPTSGMAPAFSLSSSGVSYGSSSAQDKGSSKTPPIPTSSAISRFTAEMMKAYILEMPKQETKLQELCDSFVTTKPMMLPTAVENG